MSSRAVRTVVGLALFGATSVLLALGWPPPTPLPVPLVHVAIVDPYALPPLESYGDVQRALREGDEAALTALAAEAEGYLAYRLALRIARDATRPMGDRLAAFERVLDLRIEDPLERAARRALLVEVGQVAEAAGAFERAIAAYEEALPNGAAIAGLERLLADPYRRANAYLQARMASYALEALGELAAPSIEAPALRRLGRHEAALDAYRRWLVEVPGDRTALEGEAWSLFSLERWSEADGAFAALGGPLGAYGRGLIAARQGDIDTGANRLLATGEAARMWVATGWLEARGRTADAIDAYLAIARTGDATYADDAAYRALTLAERAGEAERAALALDLVPRGSFFDLRLGGAPSVPTEASAMDPAAGSPAARHALDLARALMVVGDEDAARGELLFALRAAKERDDVVLLAETLQLRYGEYRQSQRAGQALVDAGDRDARVWRIAYPRAYPESVKTHGERFDVEPALVWSIMRQESAFSPVAVSSSNAQGLMQVIPSTWTWLAELQREPPDDPFDPDANVRYGIYYLRWLLDYFDGDVELVVPSYNRGQGYIRRLYEGDAVRFDKDELFRSIDALETREYLQRVAVNLATYRTLYDDPELIEADAQP
jgi:soluble lytic murein transglycosylase-like protein